MNNTAIGQEHEIDGYETVVRSSEEMEIHFLNATIRVLLFSCIIASITKIQCVPRN